MPNRIRNRIMLDGSISDLNDMIEIFSTHVPASLKRTHDNKLLICDGPNGGFCWFDLRTGHASNRGDLNQIGLPEGFEPEIDQAFLMFPDFKKIIPPPDDPAYRDEPSQDVAKGSPNWWYTWNNKHWGSKWGGYDYNRKALNIFEFDTAWVSCPLIIEAISKRFPRVTIEYAWADEDTGHNCGRAIFRDGLLEQTVPQGGSKEAYEIAFNLRPDRAENYELVDGKYKYKEESE